MDKMVWEVGWVEIIRHPGFPTNCRVLKVSTSYCDYFPWTHCMIPRMREYKLLHAFFATTTTSLRLVWKTRRGESSEISRMYTKDKIPMTARLHDSDDACLIVHWQRLSFHSFTARRAESFPLFAKFAELIDRKFGIFFSQSSHVHIWTWLNLRLWDPFIC